MKKLEIVVTQDDIDQGEAKNCTECPIALSLYRSFPNRYITVRGDYIVVGDEFYKMSWRSRKFVSRFDRGKNVKPSVFKLSQDPDV